MYSASNEKAESDHKNWMTLPNKCLGRPKSQLTFTALYFRQFFTYVFDKRDLVLKIYKKGCAQIQHG
jgi:hypothetical protein